MNARASKHLRDPYSLAGKNPRRVAPAVRRNIAAQKTRIRVDLACLFLAVLFYLLGWCSSWIPTWVGFVGLVAAPFLLVGVFGDRGVLCWQKAKLAECERLIAGEEDANRQA